MPAASPLALEHGVVRGTSPSFRRFHSTSGANIDVGEKELKVIESSTIEKSLAVEQTDVGTPAYKVLQSATDEAQVQWRRRTNATVGQNK